MEKLADVISALRQQQTLINTAVTSLEQLYQLSGTSQWPVALNGNGRAPKLNSRGKPYTRGPHAVKGAAVVSKAEAQAEAKRAYQRRWRAEKAGKSKSARKTSTKPAESHGETGPTTAYEHVLKALDDAAQPLMAADILRAVQAQGWQTNSAEPINVLSQALYVLTRKKTLKKFSAGGGKPALWGYPKWQKAAQAANRLRRAAAEAEG